MKSKLLTALFALTAFATTYADETPPETTPAAENTVPVYAHRLNFYLTRLGYEHIKPESYYLALEGWELFSLNDSFRFKPSLLQAEARGGYNFLPTASDHLTPFLGVGYFKGYKFKRGKRHDFKQDIVFSSMGLRYEHEFSRLFTLGLNTEIMLGHSLNNKQRSWGSNPFWGADVSVPFTWRFTKARNWDFRFEPFFTGWFGKNQETLFYGARSSIGYRF